MPLGLPGKAAQSGDSRARRPAVAARPSIGPAGDPGLEPDLTSDDQTSSEAVPAKAVTIVVCHSCRGPAGGDDFPRPGSRLADDTRRAAAASEISVRQVGCLGNCKRGLSAAVLCAGSWSYVFGDLSEDSGADLVAGALLFSRSTDGFMPYGRRPESLKRGLIARIPTMDHVKEDR